MLGLLLGAAGTALSGYLSWRNNKKMQQQADEAAAREQSYLQAKANENPLANSANQQLLGQYDRDSQRQLENAKNIAKVTGATGDYTNAVQKGIAEGRADLMSNMSADASARADAYEQKAADARVAKEAADQERMNARNDTFASLATNAANIVSPWLSTYSDLFMNDPAYVKKKMDYHNGFDEGDKYYDYHQRRYNKLNNRYKLLTGGAVKA